MPCPYKRWMSPSQFRFQRPWSIGNLWCDSRFNEETACIALEWKLLKTVAIFYWRSLKSHGVQQYELQTGFPLKYGSFQTWTLFKLFEEIFNHTLFKPVRMDAFDGLTEELLFYFHENDHLDIKPGEILRKNWTWVWSRYKIRFKNDIKYRKGESHLFPDFLECQTIIGYMHWFLSI